MLSQFIDVILHLDVHLNEWAGWMGPWLYLAMFLVIFAETGFVVTPFLPGDSLLFALGALCAVDGSPIHLVFLGIILTIAAVGGDSVNYAIGNYFGPKVFKKEKSFWFNPEHLTRTQKFYEKHGGKTIILARFVPIVRTFAPFVAGVGKMNYRRFFSFNIIGGTIWIWLFLIAGNFFGNLPAVKQNFHIVIFAIIGISVLPIVFEYIKSRRQAAT